MFMKCRYMDELTGGRGITFATGTPISNSMTELYTIMRYLQYDTLMRMGMGHFDSWAATFGETVTAIEFAQVLQAYGSNFNSIQKYAKKQRKRKCWNRQEARKPEIDMDQQRKKAINEA